MPATAETARALIVPEIEKRRQAVAEARARGEQSKSKNAVAWIEEVAKGRSCDPVINPLFFSVITLQTASDLISND